MEFEWDRSKAVINAEKHGITFFEAVSVFSDDHALMIEDPDHSAEEFRSILLGVQSNGQLLVVVYTVREATIRLISARRATPSESRHYSNSK